jgi:hypothetical protein
MSIASLAAGAFGALPCPHWLPYHRGPAIVFDGNLMRLEDESYEICAELPGVDPAVRGRLTIKSTGPSAELD